MKIIVCVDDKLGMTFNHRRQSMDSALRQKLIALCGMNTLWMNEYSANQFKDETASNIQVDEKYLDKAGANDYCFVEDQDILPYADKIQEIILCRWNRTYPADTFLKIPGNAAEWQICVLEEFPGKSHKKLTLEKWRRKDYEN